MLDLATGEELDIFTLDEERSIQLYVEFLAGGSRLVVSDITATVGFSQLFDLATGDEIISYGGPLSVASEAAFIASNYEAGTIESMFVNESDEYSISESGSFSLNPSGTHFFQSISEEGDGEATLFEAATGDEITVVDGEGGVSTWWLANDLALAVDNEGFIQTVDITGAASEIADLGIDEGTGWALRYAGDLVILSTNNFDHPEGHVVVIDRADYSMVATIEEFTSLISFEVSKDGRFLALTGVEEGRPDWQLLLLVDVASTAVTEIDDADRFSNVTISGNMLYYTAHESAEPDAVEARRAMVGSGEPPETLYEEAILLVPSDPNPSETLRISGGATIPTAGYFDIALGN